MRKVDYKNVNKIINTYSHEQSQYYNYFLQGAQGCVHLFFTFSLINSIATVVICLASLNNCLASIRSALWTSWSSLVLVWCLIIRGYIKNIYCHLHTLNLWTGFLLDWHSFTSRRMCVYNLIHVIFLQKYLYQITIKKRSNEQTSVWIVQLKDIMFRLRNKNVKT